MGISLKSRRFRQHFHSLDAEGEKENKEGEEEEEDNRDAGAETFSALAESRFELGHGIGFWPKAQQF